MVRAFLFLRSSIAKAVETFSLALICSRMEKMSSEVGYSVVVEASSNNMSRRSFAGFPLGKEKGQRENSIFPLRQSIIGLWERNHRIPMIISFEPMFVT